MVSKMVILPTNPSLKDLRDSLMAALSYSLLLRNDELRHLTCMNICVTNDGVTFVITSSKTDVFRKGKKLYLAKQDGSSSVVNLLLQYMAKGSLKINDNSFLFGKISSLADKEIIDGKVPLPLKLVCVMVPKLEVNS